MVLGYPDFPILGNPHIWFSNRPAASVRTVCDDIGFHGQLHHVLHDDSHLPPVLASAFHEGTRHGVRVPYGDLTNTNWWYRDILEYVMEYSWTLGGSTLR